MGIVVTIFMLLGLLMVSPFSKVSLGDKRHNTQVANVIGNGLLLAGLWNALWHGVRHIEYFWGVAALVSGVFMVLVAVMIIVKYGSSSLSSHAVLVSIEQKISPLSLLWIVGLFGSFCLYAVTLVQLNLGLAIIH